MPHNIIINRIGYSSDYFLLLTKEFSNYMTDEFFWWKLLLLLMFRAFQKWFSYTTRNIFTALISFKKILSLDDENDLSKLTLRIRFLNQSGETETLWWWLRLQFVSNKTYQNNFQCSAHILRIIQAGHYYILYLLIGLILWRDFSRFLRDEAFKVS